MTRRIGPLTLLAASAALAQSDAEKRIESATRVFEQVMGIAEKAIPQGLLDKAECVVIVPGVLKGAFIFGAKYGRGYMSCRGKDGRGWTAPGGMRIEGGSFGFQWGGTQTDVILLVMNPRGADRLLKSKVTLGADAAAAAGPVGRTASAETDALMTAEILTWSRSRGLFAGISLQGATLRQDLEANGELYGQKYENRDIVRAERVAPAEPAKKLLSLLLKYSPRKSK